MSIVILHNMPNQKEKTTTITKTMNKQTNSTPNLKGGIISH